MSMLFQGDQVAFWAAILVIAINLVRFVIMLVVRDIVPAILALTVAVLFLASLFISNYAISLIVASIGLAILLFELIMEFVTTFKR